MLFRIANPQNVVFLGERCVTEAVKKGVAGDTEIKLLRPNVLCSMLKFLRKTNDVFLRTELVTKITALAERCVHPNTPHHTALHHNHSAFHNCTAYLLSIVFALMSDSVLQLCAKPNLVHHDDD